MQKVLHILLSIALIGIACYGSLLIFFFFFQSRLVYFPHRKIDATPKTIGLFFEKVDFAAVDGIRLTGWLIPAHNQRGFVLFLHGNAGNISHRLETIRLLHDLGLSIFIPRKSIKRAVFCRLLSESD